MKTATVKTSSRPCSATALHGVSLRIGEKKYEEASAFPYFTAGGLVQRYMLILPKSPEIFDLEARPGALERHWWGLAVAAGHEPLPLGTRAGALGTLWHYDPWWVLADKRFAGHPAKAALKATNMVDRLERGTFDLLYRRDLSAVTGLRTWSWRWPWLRQLPWRDGLLAEPSPPAQQSPPNTWQLAPRWTKPGWPGPIRPFGGQHPDR